MPRKQNTEDLPKATPKRTPKGKPKAAPEVVPALEPKAAPKRTPRPAPIVAPIVTPENQTFFIYSLPNWEQDQGESPHNYGNGGRALGEFHTYPDAKQWLRDNGHYGHFLAVRRLSNGRIRKGSHFEIEPLEEIDGDELAGDDLALIDLDNVDPDTVEVFRNPLVRAEIEKARLKAENNALRNAPARSGYDPVTNAILQQVLPQIIRPKSTVEEIRHAKELIAELTPRREPNPTQTQSQPMTTEAALMHLVSADESLMEKAVSGLSRLFRRAEGDAREIGLLDVAFEAIKNNTLPQLVREFRAMMRDGAQLNGVSHPDPRGQNAPATHETPAASPEMPMPHAGETPPEPQSTPPGETPHAIGMGLQAFQRPLSRLLSALAVNGDVEPVISALDAFVELFPEHQPMIENLMTAPAEGVLQFLAHNVPNAAPVVTAAHAAEWMQKLQAAFLANDDQQTAEDDGPQEGAQS
jgi:hypothetical protein